MWDLIVKNHMTDDTINFFLKFDKEYTIEEFAQAIINEDRISKHGLIKVYDPLSNARSKTQTICTYEDGKVTFLSDLYKTQKSIKSAWANGAYGCMNYTINLEDYDLSNWWHNGL